MNLVNTLHQVESGKGKIKKNVKDSLDLVITANNLDKEILIYRIELQKLLELYLKRYPEVDKYSKFNVKCFNIQKYNKKGGFKKWHFEKGSLAHTGRVLVFMTYLNNIENGGTMFKYQNITHSIYKRFNFNVAHRFYTYT